MRVFSPISLCILCFFSGCGLFDNDSTDFFKVKVVSAVEAALEIHASEGSVIRIERDGNEISSFRLNRADTVVYDTGLEPSTSYIWKASHSNGRGRSIERQSTTLDTTSSNFTWQTFTFGEHSSSILYGVSVIDENDIWAVGEIHRNDSTGQADSKIYNAVHWDGEDWKLIRLQFYTFCNQSGRGSYRATSVIGFSENDIWASSLSQVTRYDGTEQKVIECIPTSVNRLWGTDNSNVYAVGSNSTISHYNGQSWQQIETNTELDFYDIHGNEQQGAVAVAAKQSQSSDKLILRVNDDQTVEILPSEPIPSSISGIWFDEQGITYVVGNRISLKSKIDSSLPWKNLNKENIEHPYLFAIDANGLNDLITVGGFGRILHFNGAGWTKFETNITGNLYDVAIKGNTVASVGLDGSRAFITIGKRE